jgi:hypothetical protein
MCKNDCIIEVRTSKNTITELSQTCHFKVFYSEALNINTLCMCIIFIDLLYSSTVHQREIYNFVPMGERMCLGEKTNMFS